MLRSTLRHWLLSEATGTLMGQRVTHIMPSQDLFFFELVSRCSLSFSVSLPALARCLSVVLSVHLLLSLSLSCRSVSVFLCVRPSLSLSLPLQSCSLSVVCRSLSLSLSFCLCLSLSVCLCVLSFLSHCSTCEERLFTVLFISQPGVWEFFLLPPYSSTLTAGVI